MGLTMSEYSVVVRIVIDADTKGEAAETFERLLSMVFSEHEVVSVESSAPKYVPVKGSRR